MKKFKFITYNVFGNQNKYLQHRLSFIVDAILSNENPDIICLQEATLPIINALKKSLPSYFFWTKLQTLDKKNMDSEDITTVYTEGFLVIISKWKFLKKEMIYKGSYYDDGIMKAILNTNDYCGCNLVVYNVHTSGGTFGKSQNIVEQKTKNRINELKLLNTSLMDHLSDNVIIGGDFNYDANNLKEYPEGQLSPDKMMTVFYDAYRKMYSTSPGATEDEFKNTFRSAMKIKDDKDKRKSRYDRIICSNKIKVKEMEIIGNKPIKQYGELEINGKDANGKKYVTMAYLFPSDHFGLYAELHI